MAQIEINPHDFNDLGKLFERIAREVLKPQCECAGLDKKLSFLNKFQKRQESWASYDSEKTRVAFGESLEFKKILLQIATQVVCVLISLLDCRTHMSVANKCPEKNPI